MYLSSLRNKIHFLNHAKEKKDTGQKRPAASQLRTSHGNGQDTIGPTHSHRHTDLCVCIVIPNGIVMQNVKAKCRGQTVSNRHTHTHRIHPNTHRHTLKLKLKLTLTRTHTHIRTSTHTKVLIYVICL